MLRHVFPLLLILAGCEATSPEFPAAEGLFKKNEKVPVVSVVTLRSHNTPLIVQTQGRSEPSERFQAKAPEGGGKIEQIFVELGQNVERGDNLVKFSETELRLKLDLAHSQIAEAEAGLKEAKYARENRQTLLEEEKLTETEAEGLDEKEALFEATLDRARNEIDLYESQLGNLTLNSPIGGLVTKREAAEEEEVEEGKVMVEVVQIEPLYFTFDVPLEVAGVLEKGSSVPIRFPDLGNREVTSEILMVGAEAGREGNVEVKLILPNETLALKAEMNGEVTLKTPLTKKIVTVPQKALLKTERSTYVYKVEGGRAKKTVVQIAGEEESEPTVIEGAGEGDQVITSNLEGLKDGVRVEIQTGGDF